MDDRDFKEKQTKPTIKELINGYENICNKIVNEFCKKQNLTFNYWIADEIGQIFEASDHFFDTRDVIFDMKTNQKKGLILKWHDKCVECHFEKKPIINYQVFCKLSGSRKAKE